MENITLGQIAVAIAFLVGLISGIATLKKHFKAWIENLFTVQLMSINNQIEGLQNRIDDVDIGACKNYLVKFLSEVEHGEQVSDVEHERFWEQYQHYTKLGGNSYIHTKVEKLKKEGKL